MNYSEGGSSYTSTFTDQGFKDGSDKALEIPNGPSPAQEKSSPVNIIIEDDPAEHTVSEHSVSEQNNLNEFTPDSSHEVSENHPQKKKKKNSVQQRIDQLSYAIGERDQYNAFLQQQLADKDALLAQKQKDLEIYQQSLVQKDNESFENLAARIKTQEQTIKRELKGAIESGDTDAQTDLVALLADIKAEEKALILRKQNEIQRAQDATYYADQYADYTPVESQIPSYAPPPVQQYDEDYQNWIEENPWYVNDNGLRTEADQIANELSRYCSLNNIRVSANDFRNKVANELRRKYGGDAQPMTNNNNYNNSPRYVAPVSNGNTNSPGTVRLTKQQFDFAKTLPSNFPGETHNQKAARYATMIEPIPKTEDGIPIYKIRFE